MSPLSFEPYETREQLVELLVRSWQRCLPPRARGEDVGVEFTADGVWYALTRDAAGNVVRPEGVYYGGTRTYGPPGSIDPISSQPSSYARLELDSVFTDPPEFTNDPRQLRVIFTPWLSKYVPLDR